MIRCPICAREYPSGTDACANCGIPLSASAKSVPPKTPGVPARHIPAGDFSLNLSDFPAMADTSANSESSSTTPTRPAFPQPAFVAPPGPNEKRGGGVLRPLGMLILLVLLWSTAAILGSAFLPGEWLPFGRRSHYVDPAKVWNDDFQKKWNEALAKSGEAEKRMTGLKEKMEATLTLLQENRNQLDTLQKKHDAEERARKESDEKRKRAEQAQREWERNYQTAQAQAAQAKRDADNSSRLAAQYQRDAAALRIQVSDAQAKIDKIRATQLEGKAVVLIRNPTRNAINYQIRWQLWDGSQTPWQSFRVEESRRYKHRQAGGVWCWVRFDWIAGDSDTTYKTNDLRVEMFYKDDDPTFDEIRAIYRFEYNSAGDRLYLYRQGP